MKSTCNGLTAIAFALTLVGAYAGICYQQIADNCFEKGYMSPCQSLGNGQSEKYLLLGNCVVYYVNDYGLDCDEISDPTWEECTAPATWFLYNNSLCFAPAIDSGSCTWYGYCVPVQVCLNDTCNGE